MKILKTTIIALFSLFSIIFFSCADFFQNKIDLDIDSENGTLADTLVTTEKITSLSIPEQIFASKAMYAGQIIVSWKSVENATSYKLQRATLTKNTEGNYASITTNSEWEDLDWETIVEKCYSTSFDDTIITSPDATNEKYSYKYCYRVLAQNIKNNLESDYTNPFEIKEDVENAENTYENFNSDKYAVGYVFAPPTNVEATKGKDVSYIKITWQAAENASYYKIYRDSREDFTTPALIKTLYSNTTEYYDSISESDQGTEFYYKVVAENYYKNDSAYSSVAMGYALQKGAPATPSNVKVINGLGTSKDKINITWDKIESTTLQEITYSVYRNSSVDSVYTLLQKDLPSDKNTYTDTKNLKTGVIYYYYVLTVGYELNDGTKTGNTLKSAFSESGIESDEPAIGFLISPPSSVECNDVEEDSNSINLTWTPAIGANISELNENLTNVDFTYNIYYSVDNLNYTILKENVSGEKTSSNMLQLKVEKKEYYKITTLNKNEDSEIIESIQSSAAAPQPDAPKIVYASKTKNLEKLYPTKWTPNTNKVYPVLITWEAPDAELQPAGYAVYRSTKSTSGFRKISEDVITNFEYLDINENSKAGIVYYYKVISLNSLGQGKKGNNPAEDPLFETGGSFRTSWGYGALTRDQWFREYNKDIASSQAKLTLMHKPVDTDKLGSETVNANIPVNGSLGTLSYTAKLSGLGAAITMPYKNYADHYINNDKTLGIYYILNGSTDTDSNMSGNGSMSNTVRCYHYAPYGGLFQGMYPGYAIYNNLQIKSGGAGGGYYLVQTYELDYTSASSGTVILSEGQVDWKVGEEIRN